MESGKLGWLRDPGWEEEAVKEEGICKYEQETFKVLRQTPRIVS